MTAEPGSAREAAERNARALMAGDLAQVMNDLTPQAFAQAMQLGQAQVAAGAVRVPTPFTPGAMPGITGFELAEVSSEPEDALFHVTFTSPAGTATLSTQWKRLTGVWKLAGIGLIDARPAEPAG